MRAGLVFVCVFLIQATALAGTNDYWQVPFRACDAGGNFALYNSEFGTKAGAKDSQDMQDVVATSVSLDCAWVACYDLGSGIGNGYSKDYRAPITDSTKTWNLKIHVRSGWAAPDVCLRVWNPAGGTDINGTIPISLKVASDPTGTHSPGDLLIPAWDPDKNGNQADPAYTFTFNNAAALLGGAVIELQLVVGSLPPVECSVGEARRDHANQAVLLSGVTASSGSTDRPGLWISSNGLPGLRVSPAPAIARGEVVDLEGTVTWTDGVPVLTNAHLDARHGLAEPRKRVMSGAALASDRREALSYSGMNPVGILCVTCGEVTARDTESGVFYVDDGAGLVDGLGPSNDPYRGLRVVRGTGISLPGLHTHVRVAGVRSIEKHVLVQDTIVNGEQRYTGEALCVPVVLTRDADDVVPIEP